MTGGKKKSKLIFEPFIKSNGADFFFFHGISEVSSGYWRRPNIRMGVCKKEHASSYQLENSERNGDSGAGRQMQGCNWDMHLHTKLAFLGVLTYRN
jgi:hypothetical protein